MEIIPAAIVGFASAVVVALISLYGSSKLGIGAVQNQLVSTLKDLTEAQDSKIAQLEDEVKSKDDKINELERTVADLERTVLAQALKISGAG